MTQSQRNYLIKRIDGIAREKIDKLRQRESLSNEELAEAVKDIKVSINTDFDINAYLSEKLAKGDTYISEESLLCKIVANIEAYKSAIWNAVHAYNNAWQERDAARSKRIAAIRAYVTTLKDELMLGDSGKAQLMLEEFVKKDF